MSGHTQMKGSGKSRHLPIGTPGSCLTEDDRDLVFDAVDTSGPECRRCRPPAPPPRVISIEFTVTSGHPATVLDAARTQAEAAFGCIAGDPALVVTVGTGRPNQDTSGRYNKSWLFLVNASWDTETGTPERRRSLDGDRRPERRR